MTGRELRKLLAAKGAKKSGPAFYQLMSRLEESGFVEGDYSQKIVEGQIIKERWYRITGEGCKARANSMQFYGGLLGVPVGDRSYA